ncbi:sugar-transfer associated ATP-grasp domain-containing protein [Halalkalicoccus subterraneus]|uniref:sugar-transfer associated ATP-grasp domain-containing protein n=1 Tax=Halalkalicoccus subterraneus TaxID=2675002 RepID=UPI000EFC896F|nr:sugar-transfer associated ATP-grasp domain-containing protein [Halalkalicoccus subterraneus]
MSDPPSSVRTHATSLPSRLVSVTATAAEYLLPVPHERWPVLARDEMTQPSPPVSLATRLRLYRHGFRARAAHLYDFETYGFDDYLSDAARYVGAYYINGAWRDAVDNKLLCHLLLSEFDEHLPAVYGILKDGRLHPVDPMELPRSDGGTVGRLIGRPDGPPSSVADGTGWFLDRLRSEGRLVCKRFKGGSGKQVLVCAFDAGEYRVNAEPCSEEELRARIDGLEDYLVTEHVAQAAYVAAIYPGSVNTMRVLTMYDAVAGEAFVPIATHRFGTRRSGALDNFSRGGLSVGVDRESGSLGSGVQYLPPAPPETFSSHPDTGAAIEGVEVPGWEAIESALVEIAERLSYIPYIGWDIVVTGEGEFSIIEANNNTSAAIQIHEPLLCNDRARQFYLDHGVI